MESVPLQNKLKPGATGSVLAYSNATDSVTSAKIVNGDPSAAPGRTYDPPKGISYFFNVNVTKGIWPFSKTTTTLYSPAVGYGPVPKAVGVREFVTSKSISGDGSAMGHGEFTGTGSAGTLTGSSLLASAEASSVSPGNAEGAGYSNDPYTVLHNSSGTFEYNPTISNLSLTIQGPGAGGSGGVAGIELAAYSSLVPTTDGSLGMLWDMVVDLNSNGQSSVGFQSASILGLNDAQEAQQIVDNLTFNTSDLSNLSIALANPQGFELFDQTISAAQDFTMSETVGSFAIAGSVPEPSTLVLAGIACTILIAVQILRRRGRRIVEMTGLA